MAGLAAARSRSRSDSPPDCHSLRSRRFATQPLAIARSECLSASRRLSVCGFGISFCDFCERVLERGMGELLARSSPIKIIQRNDTFLL